MRNSTDNHAIAFFTQKMQRAGLSDKIIDLFNHSFIQLLSGSTGVIREEELSPVAADEIQSIEDIALVDDPKAVKPEKFAVLKLNGGLGTTMGCEGPKSIISVYSGMNFLDITARQVIHFNRQYQNDVPLILMNSFNTASESDSVLFRYKELKNDFPPSFLQSKFPRILEKKMLPVEDPEYPENEWNPPGHGEVYFALQESGILDKLLNCGYHYLFISNVDNLGATPDIKIPGFMSKNGIHFLMEVAERNEGDRKGGHIARRKKDGVFTIRETGQCAPEDYAYFKDITRYQVFNTNNIWVDLAALKALLTDDAERSLDLPVIYNRKQLSLHDSEPREIIQIEFAMGSALPLFEKSFLLKVPRTRFIPVKTTEDLLLLRSDFFRITEDFCVVPIHEQIRQFPEIQLDPSYYQDVQQLERHFPNGIPSLKDCSQLKIDGDVYFGNTVLIHGAVNLTNNSTAPVHIPDGSVIRESIVFNN